MHSSEEEGRISCNAGEFISVEGVVVVRYHGTFLRQHDVGTVDATIELWRDQLCWIST